MAKRVSPEEKPWNPVEAQLAHDVLRPAAPTTLSIAEPPAPSTSRVVSIDDHREPTRRAEGRGEGREGRGQGGREALAGRSECSSPRARRTRLSDS